MAISSKTREDLKTSLPDTTRQLRVQGLGAPIEIYRDRSGIPHVRGRSAHDAFFGQGFATGQDRLWQMDYDRRRAYGRWAEYAGEAALEQDRMMRRFQIAPTVRADYEALNAATRAMLDAYTAGVNAFIGSTRALPVEYSLVRGRPEPWQPWDSLAVYKVRHILMGVFEAKLWRARLVTALGPERAANLLRGYQPGHLLIVPPGALFEGPVLSGLEELSKGLESLSWFKETEAGSNNWALAGSRTASGKPLLAGDPHRGLDTPNVYYQNHVACPEFDAVGLSFPGFPGFPHFGHNTNVAWCVTHANADYQDLYIERFRSNGATLYEYQGQWRKAQVRREVINVGGGRPEEIELMATHHGPIVAGSPASGHGIAFKYTATAGPNTGFEAVLDMLKAASVQELEEAMRSWVDPCNNLLSADVHGSISYLTRGQIPIRPMANAWLPVPGWTGEHEWQGFIPFEDLPRSRNPETGFIITANNRIVGRDYTYYIALDYSPEYRARRIYEQVKGMRKATAEGMAAIHAERISIPAQTYAQLLAKVKPVNEASRRAQRELAGWKGAMEVDAVAPTIYSAFRARLHRIVAKHLLSPLVDDNISVKGVCVEDRLRPLWSLLVTMARDNDTSLLPPSTSWEVLAARALAEGVAGLRERLGDDMGKWQWGKLHRTRPLHTLSASFPEMAPLLDPPSVPLGGDGDTPQAAGYCTAEPFFLAGTSVARYAFDLADWDNSAWIVPLGASGHPGSPHYADQAPTWGEVKLIPMLYDWDKIHAAAESCQRLEPA